jgi:hypothetical protein
VAALLESLLFDLQQRCTYLASTLGGIAGLPTEVDSYRQRMLALVSQVESGLTSLAGDPTLALPAFGKNHYHRYKRLSELVSALEWGPVAALKRFLADDALMSLMVVRMCQEVAYPHLSPLCVACGFSHYWTNPSVDLIVTPACEASHLLGLTDIYHELGHIIALRARKRLDKSLHAAVDKHFAKEIAEAKQVGKSGGFVKKLQTLRRDWKNWLIEFVADMIAANLAGPAYGWANVRLCVNQSDSTFVANGTHPADEARTSAIEVMLEKLGLAAEASQIRGYWAEFLALSGSSKPQEFDIEFPRTLLIEVRDIVHQELQNSGLKSFRDQTAAAGAVLVSSLLNEAWAIFNQSPATYAAWEAQQISKLKVILGL